MLNNEINFTIPSDLQEAIHLLKEDPRLFMQESSFGVYTQTKSDEMTRVLRKVVRRTFETPNNNTWFYHDRSCIENLNLISYTYEIEPKIVKKTTEIKTEECKEKLNLVLQYVFGLSYCYRFHHGITGGCAEHTFFRVVYPLREKLLSSCKATIIAIAQEKLQWQEQKKICLFLHLNQTHAIVALRGQNSKEILAIRAVALHYFNAEIQKVFALYQFLLGGLTPNETFSVDRDMTPVDEARDNWEIASLSQSIKEKEKLCLERIKALYHATDFTLYPKREDLIEKAEGNTQLYPEIKFFVDQDSIRQLKGQLIKDPLLIQYIDDFWQALIEQQTIILSFFPKHQSLLKATSRLLKKRISLEYLFQNQKSIDIQFQKITKKILDENGFFGPHHDFCFTTYAGLNSVRLVCKNTEGKLCSIETELDIEHIDTINRKNVLQNMIDTLTLKETLSCIIA